MSINFAANLNKMITAGLGGAVDAPATHVAVGYHSVYLDASGPEVEFETNVVAPLKSLLVTMEANQEGSGDPSPENVRPITGYDSVEVTPNQDVLTFQFGSTIYGGRLDVLAGKLYVDFELMQVLDCSSASSFYVGKAIGPFGYIQSGSFNKCNALKYYGGAASGLPLGSFMIINSSGYNNARMNFCFEGCRGSSTVETRDLNQAKLDELAAAGTPLTIVYKLEEPLVIDLDPHQVITLIGENHISTNAGTIDVSYLYHEETEGY